MLSLNSLPKENIEGAREEFVNHVFAYVLVKVIKTKLNLGQLSHRATKDQTRTKTIVDSIKNEARNFAGYNMKIDSLINHFAYKEKLGVNLPDSSYDFFKKHLIYVIASPTVELINPNDGVSCNFSRLTNNEKESILSFFSYSELRNGLKDRDGKILYSLYDLGERLGIRTCPYCNKNYIMTIRDLQESEDSDETSEPSQKTGKLINAQFDHWIPQSDSSIFQTSFYNLIPSCSNCNSSIKLANKFSLKTHIHPYLAPGDLTKAYEFNYFEDDDKHPVVYIDYLKKDELSKKLKTTFSDFKTEKIYGAQLLELKDMIELANEYGEDYIDSLQKAFPEVNLSKERIYNLIFNTSEIDENHHLRPLSKFRHDILKKLQILK